jgi:DNA-binding transcriptional LysR family regulator
MELRHLRYFVAVAETMNFRRAADQLNMTQPPLSQQIQQLERELGFQLFHRHGRSISLTAAGQNFLKDVHRILKEIDNAVRHARRTAEGYVGHLKVGYVESATYELLPDIIRRFREQFPLVDITLEGLTSTEQLTALMKSRLDVGFCRVPQEDVDNNLQVEPVLWEKLCIVLPRDHPLNKQRDITVEDLANEPFILFPPRLGKALYNHIALICEMAGFEMQIEQEASQMATIVGFVAAGMGVSLLPVSVMKLPHPGVTYMQLADISPVAMSIVWYRENSSTVLQNFLNIARLSM